MPAWFLARTPLQQNRRNTGDLARGRDGLKRAGVKWRCQSQRSASGSLLNPLFNGGMRGVLQRLRFTRTTTETMTHVYEWLDAPAKDEGERLAKEWLDQFTRPAIYKDEDWLSARVLSCDYEGKGYICSGASRMGDVWLRKRGSQSYYDLRVDVDGCSNWSRVDSCDKPPRSVQEIRASLGF